MLIHVEKNAGKFIGERIEIKILKALKFPGEKI